MHMFPLFICICSLFIETTLEITLTFKLTHTRKRRNKQNNKNYLSALHFILWNISALSGVLADTPE